MTGTKVYLLISEAGRVCRTAEVTAPASDPAGLFFPPGDAHRERYRVIEANSIGALGHCLVDKASVVESEAGPRVRVDELEVIQARLRSQSASAHENRLLQLAMALATLERAREIVVHRGMRTVEWMGEQAGEIARQLAELARTPAPVPEVPGELSAVAGKDLEP